MVTWAMVLETAVKWLIPMICVAIVGLVTAHFIKPFKAGNEAARQAEWDLRFASSTKPKEMGDKELNSVRKELESAVAKADSKIIEKLDNLTTSIDQSNKDMATYHDKVDTSMKLIQEGVQDAHLQNLIGTCEQYIKRGYITATELDAYQGRYNLYKKLGGNGHMEPWDKAIKALPHEPPKPLPTTSNSGSFTIPKTHV